MRWRIGFNAMTLNGARKTGERALQNAERARIKCQMLRNMTSAVIPRPFILRARLACVERASTANVSTTG